MKIVHFFLAVLFCSTSLGYAAEDPAFPAKIREQIETQTREMSAVGVPPEAARNMLTEMHQNRFTKENMVKAQQIVMNCAKEGLPPEPVMNKAMEGMAKQAGEQQIVVAMQTVQSRYAHANRLARTLSDDQVTVDALTHAMADGMAAGMKAADMDAVMAQLQARTRDQADDRQQLMIQTMQTVRTMARLGVHSSDVSDALCQALQHQYTYQEMKQLRHQMAQEVHQSSAQQVASRHAGSIGKGDGGGSGSSGSGSGGSGAGGSGAGGSGAGGSGGGGSGGGGSGAGGSGGGGSGGGAGGGGPGPGGNK